MFLSNEYSGSAPRCKEMRNWPTLLSCPRAVQCVKLHLHAIIRLYGVLLCTEREHYVCKRQDICHTFIISQHSAVHPTSINYIFYIPLLLFRLPLTVPCGLFAFQNAYENCYSCRRLVGLLPTQENTKAEKIQMYVHAPSRIRSHDPIIWASDDTSCLGPLDHCDGQF
jgi:hypothetical protein